MENQPDATAALQPAAVGPRILAGLIDTALILLLLGIIFPVQLQLRGTLVPLWTIASVVIACNVLPAWLFGATLGLKLNGLRIVKPDGERADPLELTFRELIGRGIAAVSYLASVTVGFVAMLTNTGALTLPVGSALLLFVGALALLGLALLGQMAIFVAPQNRSLADFLGRVLVIRAPSKATPPPATADDGEPDPALLWEAQAARRRVILFYVAGALLLAVGAGLPFIGDLGMTGNDFGQHLAERQAEAELQSLRKRFRGNQANQEIAAELSRRLRWRDLDEEAEQVLRDHQAARKLQDEKQEQKLRAILAKVADWDALVALLELLDQQGRLDDARQIFHDYIQRDTSLDSRASYGIWLYDNDFTDEAVAVLRSVTADGAEAGNIYAYLGFALQELGEKSDARDAFVEAVERSPFLAEQLGEEIRQLDAVLPPRPKKKAKKPKKTGR